MRIEYENQVIDGIKAAIRKARRDQKEIYRILLADNEWDSLMRELKVRVADDIDVNAVKASGQIMLYGVDVQRWEGGF